MIFTILLTACSGNISKKIIGDWQINPDGSGESLSFYKDGTFTMAASNGISMVGTYELLDKDTIRLDMEGLASNVGPIIATISISQNKLALNLQDGGSYTYERVKLKQPNSNKNSGQGNPENLDPKLVEYSECISANVTFQDDKGAKGTITNNCPIDVCDPSIAASFKLNGENIENYSADDVGRLKIGETKDFVIHWGDIAFNYDNLIIRFSGTNFFDSCK